MRDPDIRLLLRKAELSHYLNDPSSKIVEEMNIPAAKARIDMAVINGHLHGYEIKSAADTLNRLPSQVDAYTKVFDYLSVVTEGKYYERLLKMLPEWIGVYVCSGNENNYQIDVIRKPSLNDNKEAFFLAKLLWRDEIIDVLDSSNIPYKKNIRHWILCETLANSMAINELSQIVRLKLKQRATWKQSVTADCEVV